MRMIYLALALLVSLCAPAVAQSPAPVLLPSGCGTGNITNSLSYLTVDATGQLCVTTAAGAQITGNATGTTGAVVGTLAAAAAKSTFICGFDVTAIGGTATVGPITVAGLAGGSATYYLTSSVAGSVLSRTYTPCIQASAQNTAITITTTADGSASAVTVNSWGYQQ